MLEDAGAQSVAGWATAISPGPANESSQTVSFTASADTPALFAVQPAIAADGTLTYTPAAERQRRRHRSPSPRVDNGGTANGGSDTSARSTFTITITAVNDAPSFTAGANQTVLEDAGAQISPRAGRPRSRLGPANESSQTVSFTATADNPALFTVQPAIAADGTLTYTPAADANGLATITVTAIDNGGTANGGIEHQRPSTLTITVDPVNDAPTLQRGIRSVGCLPPRRTDRSQAGRRASRQGRRTSPPRTSPSPSRAPTEGSSQSNPQ